MEEGQADETNTILRSIAHTPIITSEPEDSECSNGELAYLT
jgi:hypothetical protein